MLAMTRRRGRLARAWREGDSASASAFRRAAWIVLGDTSMPAASRKNTARSRIRQPDASAARRLSARRTISRDSGSVALGGVRLCSVSSAVSSFAH
ncbi:TPA: hypothetical protein QDE50_25230 [Burkholderia cenocepacia]|nr:hypothetical protein [Burkholderia cenocepacia]HDR9887636.1 hypothetical protein [Burkholderia cenocepacia]